MCRYAECVHFVKCAATRNVEALPHWPKAITLRPKGAHIQPKVAHFRTK